VYSGGTNTAGGPAFSGHCVVELSTGGFDMAIGSKNSRRLLLLCIETQVKGSLYIMGVEDLNLIGKFEETVLGSYVWS
jgi:hypothetical protein